MKTGFGYLFTSLVLAASYANAEPTNSASFGADNLTTFGKRAWQESAQPVRPGVPGEKPFWNDHAKRFIYSPAFDFDETEGASRYRFEIVSQKAKDSFSFEADKPWAPLSPVWAQVPVGAFEVVATALSDEGTTLGESGRKRAWRAAPVQWPVSSAATDGAG